MKDTLIPIIVVVVAAAILFTGLYLLNAKLGGDISNNNSNSTTNANSNTDIDFTELKVTTITNGTGDRVTKTGDSITVNYTGMLKNGTVFDSSVGGQPFTFTLGANKVIQGWEQGLLGMKVGEERTLNIPSNLGYGATGAGSQIPPNSGLIFNVTLVSIN